MKNNVYYVSIELVLHFLAPYHNLDRRDEPIPILKSKQFLAMLLNSDETIITP